MLISPDHPTFLSTKKHTHGYVPVAIAGAGVAADKFTRYSDTNAAASTLLSTKAGTPCAGSSTKREPPRRQDAKTAAEYAGAWRTTRPVGGLSR